MGTLVWSPLAMGMLTGKIRKGQEGGTQRSQRTPGRFTDERKLDAVEQLIPLAEKAGLSMVHMAMAFAVSHPAVTSAIIGPRTMEQLDDVLAGAEVTLDDEVLDRIDEIVPPGVDANPGDVSYEPPAIGDVAQRRRPREERAAAGN